MTQIISTNTYGGASALVSPLPWVGNYDTLNEALTQATSGVPIFLAPGTYSTDSTLVDNVNIVCYSSAVNDVTITGSLSNPTGPLTCSFSRVTFESSGSGANIVITGDYATNLEFNNCTFNSTGFSSILITLSGSSNPVTLNFNSCTFNGSSPILPIFSVTGLGNPQINFLSCTIVCSSPVTNDFSSGVVTFKYCELNMNANFSGVSGPELLNCISSTFGTPWDINTTFGSYYYQSIIPDSNVTTKLTLNICTVSSTTVLSGIGEIVYDTILNLDTATPYVPTSSTIGWNPVTLGFTQAHELTLETPLVVSSGGTGLAVVNPADGSLLIGNGTDFTLNTLTAGTGINIVNSTGGIIISSTASSIPFFERNTSFTANVSEGYYCTGPLTATLPASPINGDVVSFITFGVSPTTVEANTGQYISLGNVTSIIQGTAESTLEGNALTLRYRAVSDTWVAEYFIGSWNIT